MKRYSLVSLTLNGILCAVLHKRMSIHDSVWVSGTDKGRTWIWESTGRAMHDIRNWCLGEPSRKSNANGAEHHVQKHLENGGCWREMPGNGRAKFVCESPLVKM